MEFELLRSKENKYEGRSMWQKQVAMGQKISLVSSFSHIIWKNIYIWKVYVIDVIGWKMKMPLCYLLPG